MSNKKNTSFAHMISRGATGVALTAGVLAAGAALADKKTRQSLSKGAQEMMSALEQAAAGVTEQAKAGYQAVAHQVRISKKASSARSGRGTGRISKKTEVSR
ncbi:hypothetical protein A2631_06080 [Candidatus Daviesbacteria bacterium RIFCSPHIGHO2_01_FULL_44_29]|uniref:Uncharacterized protein n=1 Tax=Candidatus Daviesbacteria bacterium RIFCSPHIGHO2_02_FULL_43_12 TaxID=1797776 RepID=A0A1F5KJB3_9BACT|nr:MAG: hypothetical protein A2631_06080 [Candidatus Daviesbacteria bacterium RIFCSPHIGHO2_01_FULL_44_29]OGE39161.1 MAG: hypothetical protein A3E86_03415 [Candidatus Daviesbacteria bacterium RIFCSPHIGHO2_12_FULL_47_45]OGE40964.1 MAG: hypothetical protein A3D25_02910 [Candidatus Daviesbacteria bacterium RIFCSPHIGHO2_02_FULL_43_12]OGE69885.1 MAG: hypothetical protein A3B55_05760 [Candidatus Daviesbacteria bacterium RIFCSPLOWO2_01_FULL_43_15]